MKAQMTGLHDNQITKHQQYSGAVGVKHAGLVDLLWGWGLTGELKKLSTVSRKLSRCYSTAYFGVARHKLLPKPSRICFC